MRKRCVIARAGDRVIAIGPVYTDESVDRLREQLADRGEWTDTDVAELVSPSVFQSTGTS